MTFIPHVIEKTEFGERAMDLYSTLLKDRIIMISGGIDDHVASSIISQLLYLESQDPKADIYLYINSPGGVVTSGLSIYDTMNFITPDVVTICVGQAASMGALLLSSGTKGKRYALPSSRVMIHQPLGGSQGQATDIEIQAKEILRMKKYLNAIMAKQTEKTVDQIQEDTERDNFMIAEEALEYGIVDHIFTNREMLTKAS